MVDNTLLDAIEGAGDRGKPKESSGDGDNGTQSNTRGDVQET